MNSKLLLVLIILVGKIVMAQDLPEIVPPSPRAETFHIYGDVPVSYNTGVPDISIPLYTIESDGITVPIVLRYHISSIKPGADNSNIAFGWTLDVGGRISRTVNQWPDEYVPRPNTFKLTNDLDVLDENDFSYLHLASGNNGPVFDTQYDMFTYSFLGEHGNFIMNNQEDINGNSNITIHQLIESPKKVSLNMASNTDFPAAGNNTSIDYFKIVKGTGQTYYFGENKNYEVVELGSEWGRSPSSWLLTRVISADKSSTIDFTYDTVPLYYVSSYVWADIGSASPNDDRHKLNNHYAQALDAYCSSDYINDNSISYEVKTIKEISFNKGRVVFNLSTDKKRINSIEVRDNDNVLIKTVSFTRSYFSSQNAYERLDKVDINNQNGLGIKTYEFEYFDYGLPKENQTDFWGHFNGKDNFSYDREIRNYPNEYGSQFFCQTASNEKDASLNHSKSYVLNKIIYPTGGVTEFDYELNEFIGTTGLIPLTSSTIKGGGLRVKSIINKTDETSQNIVKTYEYTPRVFNTQTPKSPLNPYNYTTTSYFMHEVPVSDYASYYDRYRSRRFSHNFNSGLDTQINYEEITEYQGSTFLDSNIGKTVYNYEYSIENQYLNKNVLDDSYGWSFGSDLTNQLGLGRNKLWYLYGASGGKLKSTEYFKSDGNSYIPIKKVTNTYNYLPIINSFKNLNVVLVCSYAQAVTSLTGGAPDSYLDQFYARKNGEAFFRGDSDLLPVLGCYDSFICQSSANLIKQEVIEYQDTDTPLITTTEYAYNDKGLVTEQSTVTSRGETQKTKTIYPDAIQTASILSDGSSIAGGNLTTSAYTAAIGMQKGGVYHQPATPIQIETYKKDETTETLLSVQRTNFKVWDLDQDNIINDIDDAVLPEFIETSKGENVLEERIVFKDYYENGNVKEVHKTDGTHVVYIWGYNQTQPIAKIENVTYDDIQSYVANLQSLSDADNDNCLDTENCNESVLREALSVLRANLPDTAMMTSYTYNPLIGITSTTDARGYTTYYEYDDFNRLEQVKDAEGNIISKSEYHYKGQQ
ncbi:RHS repeat domain-containing protein [Neotamlana laminarinivorans]|uniref:RHS repeat protein n=1 Tax=Neotamlana laminarinivorans TaxID=2883124 RepID=A0A9X1L229_9FLAO|nr:RHS repeat domain-containing protein [Tamlana laminarinivorans]MCB4797219.1 RHS repeat protein [Tamlana laminarinivorans]